MSRFSLTEDNLLVDMDKGLVYSPSRGAWIRASMSVADALDGQAMSDEKAEDLINSGRLNEPKDSSKELNPRQRVSLHEAMLNGYPTEIDELPSEEKEEREQLMNTEEKSKLKDTETPEDITAIDKGQGSSTYTMMSTITIDNEKLELDIGEALEKNLKKEG